MSDSKLTGNLSVVGSPRSIGDILVATGRLTNANLQRILVLQQDEHIPFGEAAIALQLLSKEDINFALSKQFDYSYLNAQDSSVSPQLVAAFKPFSRIGENLRAVRSQLMLRWLNSDANYKVLAVVSPDRYEGRSFVAANLAIVFAQHGERTLLIDGDLRAKSDSGQQALFKLERGMGLSGFLSGRAGLEAAQQVPGLPGLTVLAAGSVPPNPQELLGRSAFNQLLLAATSQFDVILIDTPSARNFADAEIVAARAGSALLIARKHTSLLKHTAALSRRLIDSGVNIVGSILNDD
jgi:receptor protein-tyrosine kinase